MASFMHCGDIDGLAVKVPGNKWKAGASLVAHTDSHNAIPSATITGNWNGGFTGSSQCVTGSSGIGKISTPAISNSQPSVTFTISDMNYFGLYPYVPGDNHDPDGDSNGTAITINKP